MKYAFKIEDAETPHKQFVWSLKGDAGGVHVWAQFMEKPPFGDKCYGGIEVHYPYKPYDYYPDKPSHEKCWLTDRPCWSDGSSLYFSERIQPMVEDYENEPEKITEFVNATLLDWYQSHLSKDAQERPG